MAIFRDLNPFSYRGMETRISAFGFLSNFEFRILNLHRVLRKNLLDGLGVVKLFLNFLGSEGIERPLLGVAEVTQGFRRAVETAIG